MKQLVKTRKNQGGRATKAAAIERQAKVEKLMKMGYSLTKISAVTINDKKLGAIDTISKDMDIIKSRWLDQDNEWFNRARIARIEAKERLLEQMTRMGDLILKIMNGDYNNKIQSTKEGGAFVAESNGDLPKKLVYAESQLTTIISKIYEIDADFDPEQYLDQKIMESMENKIEQSKTKAS